VAEKWRAVDPARSAFAFAIFVRTTEPTDLSSYTTAFCEGGAKVRADPVAAANAVQERRLENARYS
jgi:hypothetical protein